MQFCPYCKTEYTDEAMLCFECRIPLVETLPAPDPVDVCDECGMEIGIDSDFCPFCGTLFAADQYSCTNHPIAVATGVCVVCQKLFCPECLTVKKKSCLCRDHASVQLSEGWALVHSTGDYIEAEIVRGKLENAGIPTNPRNVGNIATLADGFIDNTLGRTIFKYPVKIFVPQNRHDEAVDVIAADHTHIAAP